MLLRGRSHCGNISFDLEWEPDPVEIPARACGCTFCVKHGGVWTSTPGGKLKVVVENGSLVSRYQFGTKTAEFLVCARCGAVPVATSSIDGQLFAVVSVNALEGVSPSLLQRGSSNFDGEETGSRLARRKRNWIGSVEISEGS